MLRPITLLLPLLLASLSWAQSGPVAQTDHVKAELFVAKASEDQGFSHWLGLELHIQPHWHVYWRNPGDSGTPPRVKWTSPEGSQIGPWHWPAPRRIPIGPLMNYGYEDRLILLAPATLPKHSEGRQIQAEVAWLVCKESCIPEKVSLQIPISDPPLAHPERMRFAQDSWPTGLAARLSLEHIGRDDFVLNIRHPDLAALPDSSLANLHFLPRGESIIDHASSPEVRRIKHGLSLTLAQGEIGLLEGDPTPTGLLQYRDPQGQIQTLDLSATQTHFDPEPVTEKEGTEKDTPGLRLALISALLGGLILNLMPCVFPVLSIKVLGFVEHAHTDRRVLARTGWFYSLGVILSFILLAGVLLVLGGIGAGFGWGFQLQNPVFVALMFWLMILIGLNLMGFFELQLPAWIDHLVNRLDKQKQADQAGRNALGTGFVAVLLATPCTAPFMGAALGYALTQPPLIALAIFATLGLGMALPILILSHVPAWTRLLPRPGPWMLRFRQLLAFPLFATSIWLLWVLGNQAGQSSLIATLTGLLVIIFVLWLNAGSDSQGRPLRLFTSIILIGLSVALLPGMSALSSVDTSGSQGNSENKHAATWSQQALDAHRRDGRAVLVNLTADWCITCLVNERVALNRPAVQQLMQERNIAYLKGDWTRQDPAISQLLQQHQRSGVPLYLLYPSNPTLPPAILPQILTEARVIDALRSSTP